MRVLRWSLLVLVLAAIAWSIAAHPWGWLYGFGVHPYPESSSTPWTYQLESGMIPALTVLGLVTLITGMWHAHNCHAEGCWRIGRHRIDGTPWCNVHHTAARESTAAVQDAKMARLVSLLLAEAEDRAAAR